MWAFTAMPQPCDFPASEMVPWSTGLCGKSLSLFPSQSPVCWALWTAGFLLPPGWLIYLVKLCWEACWEPYTFLLRAISGVSVFQRGTVCVCVCTRAVSTFVLSWLYTHKTLWYMIVSPAIDQPNWLVKNSAKSHARTRWIIMKDNVVETLDRG